jgi:hypothetical protein
VSSRSSIIYEQGVHVYYESDYHEICFYFDESAEKNKKYDDFSLTEGQSVELAIQILKIFSPESLVDTKTKRGGL